MHFIGLHCHVRGRGQVRNRLPGYSLRKLIRGWESRQVFFERRRSDCSPALNARPREERRRNSSQHYGSEHSAPFAPRAAAPLLGVTPGTLQVWRLPGEGAPLHQERRPSRVPPARHQRLPGEPGAGQRGREVEARWRSHGAAQAGEGGRKDDCGAALRCTPRGVRPGAAWRGGA